MFMDTGTMLKFVWQLLPNVQEASYVGSQGQKRGSGMLDVQTYLQTHSLTQWMTEAKVLCSP